MMMLWIVVTLLSPAAYAFLAYDCTSPNANYTTLSLLEVGMCSPSSEQPSPTRTKIQLLQTRKHIEISYIACRVKLTRLVAQCGYISDSVDLPSDALASYYVDVSQDVCRDTIKYGTFTHRGSHKISDISPGKLSFSSLILAGVSNKDGDCTGATYTDVYGTYKHVVVHGSFEILASEGVGILNLDTGLISIGASTTCHIDEERCFSEAKGHAFWKKPVPKVCESDNYVVLYTGWAEKTLIDPNRTSSLSNAIYTVTDKGYGFGLMVKKEYQVCGYTIYHTEQPDLFIVETERSGQLDVTTTKDPLDFDWAIYTNSKFVYLEKHLSGQLNMLARQIVKSKCELERRVLEHSTLLATLAPDEYAVTLMNRPGYIAYQAGEMLNIHECIPVEVSLWSTQECYKELPVNRSGSLLYMTPRTHILKTMGTPIECSQLARPAFKIEGRWIEVGPYPRIRPDPSPLTPTQDINWVYEHIPGLSSIGVYQQSDLDSLRSNVMFPLERQSVATSFDRRVLADFRQSGTLDFTASFNELNIKALSQRVWGAAWGRFVFIGNIVSGCLGIYAFVLFCKYIVDTVVHAMILHDIYGAGAMLLCALWDSLTSFAIHRKTRPDHRGVQSESSTATSVNPPEHHHMLYQQEHAEVKQSALYPPMV